MAGAQVAIQRELANAKIKKEHWLDKRTEGEAKRIRTEQTTSDGSRSHNCYWLLKPI